MKSAITRVTIRPGKSVAVSSEAMARARGALEAFGVTEADLERLAGFKGDVTIGPKRGLVRPAVVKMTCVDRALKRAQPKTADVDTPPVAGRSLKAA